MSNPVPVDALIEHQAFLRALARELLGDADRADDAVQDAYASALRSPPCIESEPGTSAHLGAVRAWLATVVRNHARNVLRGETRRADRERLVARAESVHDDVGERLRVQRRVLDAVESLREPYRTAVYLRYAEGLPPRTIAERTQAPVETVRSRVQRGLEMLRRDLDRECGERDWRTALAPFAALPAAPNGATAVPPFAWLAIGAALVAIPVGFAATERRHADALAALPPIEAWSAPSVRDPLDAGATRASARTPVDAADVRNAVAVPTTAARVVRYVDARGDPLDGVRGTESRAYDAASGVELRIVSRSVAGDGATETVLDVAAQFELDADARDLEGAEFELAGHDGAVAAVSRAHVAARPFVRFAAAPRATLLARDGGASWTLVARTRDGARRATARVHAVRGRAAAPIALEFAPVELVALHVASALPLADVRATSSARVLATDDPTRFAYEHADGAEIVVAARGHRARSFASTGASALEVVLEPRDGHALAIDVESASARADLAPEIEIAHETSPLESRTVRAAGARTTIDDLAPGTYVVTPRDDGPWGYDPPRLRVEVPGGRLRFVRRDEVDALPLVVRARDARGRAIERVRCALLSDPEGIGKRAAAAARTTIAARDVAHGDAIDLAVAPDRAVWWLVEADGCASAYGDEGDLRRVDGRYELDVRLEPSWRCEMWLAARGESGAVAALGDARVTTRAGRVLATSLADGRVVLDLPYDPGQLRIECPGRRVAAWEGFANGRRRTELSVHRVLLEPAR